MLLAGKPSFLQTRPTNRLGFVQRGVGPKPLRAARFSSPDYGECLPGQPASYEGESPRYVGTWEPFYYSARTFYNDPTLMYQAPRQGYGTGPASQQWFDPTLTMQAERGPDVPYGPQLGAVGAVEEMSTATKAALVIGSSVLLIGGAYLVIKHTVVKTGF